MKFISVCLFSAGIVLAHAQYAGSQPIPAQYRKGVGAISVDKAKKDLTYLANTCEGRGTGQPGFYLAANYVASKYKEAGLKPVGDKGTYFQNVPFYHYGIDPAASFIATADSATKIVGGQNIAFGRLGVDVDQTKPVVLVRANGADALLPGTDALDGKIVIVVGNGDVAKVKHQVVISSAAAVVYVKDVFPDTQGTVTRNKSQGSTSLTGIMITHSAAQRLCIALTGDSTAIDCSKTAPGTAEIIDTRVSLHLMAKGVETPILVPNVVGVLEGSDPKLKAELIGIGAHLDHFGWRGDVIMPGADDDGSGSTAVLEIVNAMKVGGVKPKRSILFMTFCGEEMGLLGSGYYSDHPIFPHDQMVAELQMDMVGRDSDGIQNGDPKRIDKREENIDTMRLVGSKRISTDLHTAVMDDNKYIGFKFKWDAEDVYTRSDHYNFAKHGIPIAFLFDGFHPDYHQPTDTVDKIDWAKLTNAAKLYYIVALDLANRTERPRKDVPQANGG